MKRLAVIGALAVLAAAASFTVIGLTTGSGTARANPPGAPEGTLAFKFNYHAVPEGTDPNCGSGAKVYTEIGQSGQIVWELDTSANGFDIEDCKTASLDGDYAWIVGDAADKYSVYVVLLGKNSSTNSLSICRQIITDITDIVDTNLCELGSVDLSRGGGTDRFAFDKKLFADDAEGELWTLDPGTGFRIAQIRLYEAR